MGLVVQASSIAMQLECVVSFFIIGLVTQAWFCCGAAFYEGLKVLQCSINIRTLQLVAQACSAAVQHAFGGACIIFADVGLELGLAVQASSIAVQLECVVTFLFFSQDCSTSRGMLQCSCVAEVFNCCRAVTVLEPCNL